MPRIAYVTCANLPEPDPDEALLLEASSEAGIEAELAAWDDASVDWSVFDAAILRSTWNYHREFERFQRWITHVEGVTTLLNGSSLIRRTLHKGYLLDLEAAGTEIVPTRLIRCDSAVDLEATVRETGWSDFVVKPAISAASFMTRRFSSDECDEAAAFLGEVLKNGDGLVQEYMRSVWVGGEVDFVVIDGEVTHGVRKDPRFEVDLESVSHAVHPSGEQSEVVGRVLDWVGEPSLYGRVDLMRTDAGRWVVSEVEFIEPSLFFLQHPPALQRFVAAIPKYVGWRPDSAGLGLRAGS